MKTRDDAKKLLNEWVTSDSLKKHCFAVAAAMEESARQKNLSVEEIENWYLAGLLHDMDYEKFPSLDLHTIMTCKELRAQEYPEEILVAILCHNAQNKLKPNTLMAKTLVAVDELSGLIVALAKVRPEHFDGMTAESVKKVLKKLDFAASISREDIAAGILDLGVDEDAHYTTVIDALSKNSKEIGF